MCGRFAQSIPLGKLTKIDLFDEVRGEYSSSYNLSPTENAFVVSSTDSKRVLKQMKWGLIPSWTKPDRAGSGLINARFESLNEKPSFRSSYRQRRCIVPVTGFYEWRKEGKQKIPYFISCGKDSDGEFNPMLLCGIYDSWISPDGEVVTTFTVITREASGEMKPIHERMPLILDRENIGLWIGNDYSHELHADIISGFDASKLEIYRVSDSVNSHSNKTERCIEPLPQ